MGLMARFISVRTSGFPSSISSILVAAMSDRLSLTSEHDKELRTGYASTGDCMNISSSAIDVIGGTPLVDLSRLAHGLGGRLLGKLE